MDCRPPDLLLLLTSLLHFSHFARGEQSYTIDTVGLTILPSYTVQSGTPVTLRCQVSVSHDNIPNLTHTFQLTRNSFPIFTDTTTEDSVVYELNPARAADSGTYECRVTVKDKSKFSNGELVVTGLQTPILHLSNTKPFESEEFTATCSAPDEKGSLIFRFYQRFRSREPLKIKELAPTGNSSETTLVLRQVGDSLLFCDYDNLVSSGIRSSNRSNEIQVIVRALYISPIMNVLHASVFEGDVVEIVCKVVNPPGNVEVFLTKDKRILKKASGSLVHRLTAKDSDSGEFVCKAEQGNVQKETYRSITVKEILSKPHLLVEPLDIFEGDRFKLTCIVKVYFPAEVDRDTMQFFIYKDNINLTTSDTYSAVANPDGNGNYSCKVVANSVRRSIVKESTNVVIKAKIPVSKPMLSVVGGTLVLGKPFQLLCHSNSGTLPITYKLYGPGKFNKRRIVSKPEERAIFNCSAIFKISDLDEFLCHVNNKPNTPPMIESGQQLRHSSTIIEPVSKPVLRPSSMSISEGQSTTIGCSVKHGTPPIQFSLYHEKNKSLLMFFNSSNLEVSYNLTDVKQEDEGKYYCVGTNVANETKQSERVTIQVTLAQWKKGLIAAFCILLVLMLILGWICKKNLRTCKRKRMGHELAVKSTGTKVERLSLTQAEFEQAANVTPGMIGKNIWSDHVSTSESDDQNSVAATEPECTEVETKQAEPNKAPVNEGTDSVCSEVRNSKLGVPEQADVGSVEYAELNHDTDHKGDAGNHGNQSVQDDHIVEIDNSVDVNAATCGE
ncbi:platelet endothelial cell adhesion molecule isoform X2 [Anabas testudineus]|uniref:platelet endothelial cell adhesion molecule isoform X2 n=1 Tax=Anabas testudineus TaxID=64144 RepID=UPI000E464415|nr:platelet endothelial cell adhesion molecule isoform X2 [Anabas testudineus]